MSIRTVGLLDLDGSNRSSKEVGTILVLVKRQRSTLAHPLPIHPSPMTLSSSISLMDKIAEDEALKRKKELMIITKDERA